MAKSKPKLRHGEVQVYAQQIVDLLAQRHAEDVFVPECKNGPSQSTSHVRLDAWAMKKSWSNPLSIGYEVKVNRQDFLRDDKWQAYLPYCNEFYFVCPQGLIADTELPPEAGLLYVSATGSRLFLKKKCVRRNVDIPESLYRYVLMCRAKIARHWHDDASKDKAAEWRNWLAKKEADRELGYNVSRAVQETLKTRVREAQSKVKEVEERMSHYDEIRRFLREKMGTDDVTEWAFRRSYDKLHAAVPDGLTRALRDALAGCERLQKELEEIGRRAKPPVSAAAAGK